MRKKTWLIFPLLAVMLLACASPAMAAGAMDIQGYAKSKGYDYVTLGQYPTDEDGTVRPILWRVLQSENGEAYLMSEYILFASPIHEDYDHYPGWEGSELFAYLNDTFLRDAFSAEEQQTLLQRTEDGGLVTLATIDEIRDAALGFASNNDRLCESTAWAKREREPKKLTLYIYSKGHKYSPWWSRTRSQDYAHQQRRVMDEGKVGRVSVGNPDLGVRPVVYVDLSRLTILGGSGVKDDPWQLQPIYAAAATDLPAAEEAEDSEAQASLVTEESPTVTPDEIPQESPLPIEDVTPSPEQIPQEEVSPTAEIMPAATLPPDDGMVFPEPAAATDAPVAGTGASVVAIVTIPGMNSNPLPQADEPAATPIPQETTNAPVIDQAAESVPTAPPAPVETAAPTAEPVQPAGYTAAALPENIHEKFPVLDEKGFLPEGQPEFVLKDEANGLWLYASHTLRIEINRRTGTNSKNEPLRWYEAQVFTRDSNERFDLYPWDETRYTNINVQALADEIARKHHLVFGINSDYFIYRLERDREESYNYPLGIEIRDGQVLAAWPRNALSTVYPPLDTMALYPDGSIRLFKNDQLYTPEFADYLKRQGREDYKALADRLVQEGVTPEQLLADGVTDTLSFGPILVENGEVSPRSKEFGNTPNPRTAFGMVEPGYYICVMVESRITESKGESCVWLGQKMAELGCASAINLDGGATSTMIFMGEQINKSGNYGDITNRKQNELLGVGYSDAVQ